MTVGVRVDPAGYLPLSVQLQEQLKQQIRRGLLQPGARLPSVRELAGFLRVNRNTVLKALRELERGGYIRSHQGKGIFVADRPALAGWSVGFEALVEETVARAQSQGVDPEALGLALLTRQAETGAVRPPPAVLLIECNQPALRLYRRNLEEELGVRVDPLLVSDLERRRQEPSFIGRYALVVTTFFHVEEVQALLRQAPVSVVALLAEASLDTLMRLLTLPAGTSIGLVCEDREGTENLSRSLEKAGLSRLRVLEATTGDAAGLARLLERAEVVVTTSDCAVRLRELAPGKEVVVEDSRLDRSGIELVRNLLRRAGSNRSLEGGISG